MKIYLAGPMRGIPHFNHPAFHQWTAHLRGQGHEVFSPAEHDAKAFGDIATDNPTGDETKANGFSRRAALAADMTWICANADAIALMPGWALSSGACAEKALGLALGLEIIYLAEPSTPPTA